MCSLQHRQTGRDEQADYVAAGGTAVWLREQRHERVDSRLRGGIQAKCHVLLGRWAHAGVVRCATSAVDTEKIVGARDAEAPDTLRTEASCRASFATKLRMLGHSGSPAALGFRPSLDDGFATVSRAYDGLARFATTARDVCG